MNKEKISIVMPIYNESLNDLKSAFTSIINQSYKDIEFIIVNDNPAREINNTFLKEIKDPRVKILSNDKNRGIVYSLNRGINEATSKYIARMDADDISNNDRLEKEMNFLLENDLDIVGSNVLLIDEENKEIGRMCYASKKNNIKRNIKYKTPLPHPTWLAKKELFISLGGYKNFYACEDYEFLCRAFINKAKINCINEFLLRYRIRKESITNSNLAKQFLSARFVYASYSKKGKIDEEDLNQYFASNKYQKDASKYDRFLSRWEKAKKHHPLAICSLLFSKYFWFQMKAKRISKEMENYCLKTK